MESVHSDVSPFDRPMRLSDYSFPLPPELIAQRPAERRDAARLLILDRRLGTTTHSSVAHLPEHLRGGDLLVVNDTKVIPARIIGRHPGGATVELLLIRAVGPDTWVCLGKPARRLRIGTTIILPTGLAATIATAEGAGRYTIVLDDPSRLAGVMEAHGDVPLPPYIRRAGGSLPLDRSRYQTVFAAHPGAIAAPTAGLHFTDELIGRVSAAGIQVARLTLHVGPGTFLPVRDSDVRSHVMEAEWCDIPDETAAAIRRTKQNDGRVVAVGTTTTRALESSATAESGVRSGGRWANLFIVPGYRFRIVDALLTNFHLPASTLLLLVSAFAGRERVLAAYLEAIRRRYRFYSYGDAMLLQ